MKQGKWADRKGSGAILTRQNRPGLFQLNRSSILNLSSKTDKQLTTQKNIKMRIQKRNTARGFTLVEIMIVVAIIALLAVIAVPNFLRARKRGQATSLLNNLRLIDAAKDQYTIETMKSGIQPLGEDLRGYFVTNSTLYNALFNSTQTTFFDGRVNNVTYYINATDVLPSIDTEGAFSDVIDSSFWSPYTSN